MKYCLNLFNRKQKVQMILGSLLLFDFYNLREINLFNIIIFLIIAILLFSIFKYVEELINNELILEEQILQEAKMAEVGKMIGVITHEINNPIGIIKSQAMIGLMMLQKGNNEIEAHTKLYQSVKNNSDRTGLIIQNIKNIVSNQLTEDQLGEFHLKEIIDKTLNFLQIKIKKTSITIENTINETDLVFGNSSHLEHVFLNLISNSIDAIKELPNPWIKIEYRCDEKFSYVTVTDSGNGIPEEYLKKIEKGYFTSKGSAGSGQGLVLCKKIMLNHGGELKYIKAENTTFETIMPRGPRPA